MPVVVVPAYNEAFAIRDTLDSLSNQTVDSDIVVVDNASTDDTPNIIADEYPDIHLLHEPQKGTGYAVNTGFAYAIGELGASHILRTDADTVPNRDWAEAAEQYFAAHPAKMLVTGSVLPKRDKYWRFYDEAALPLAYTGYRIGASLLQQTRWPLRVARGGNMGIAATAFQEVGGFPDCAISEQDDDIELTRRVNERFGFSALANHRGMVVRTSQRRIRAVGYTGLIPYYVNFTSTPTPVKRQQMTGGVDIR